VHHEGAGDMNVYSSIQGVSRRTDSVQCSRYLINKRIPKGAGKTGRMVFFFLVPRRRAARHFIKVEKNKGLDRPHPAPSRMVFSLNI